MANKTWYLVTDISAVWGVGDTAEEALARAGDGPSNKGREAAEAALAMAALYTSIDSGVTERTVAGS